MKLKLAEIRALENSLVKLTNKELPIKTAYKLGKLLKIVSEELAIIENSRIKLVKKYSGGAKEGDVFEVEKGMEEEFRKEFSELLSEEIVFEFNPLPLSDLGDIYLTPIDLVRLDKLIYDDTEKTKE